MPMVLWVHHCETQFFNPSLQISLLTVAYVYKHYIRVHYMYSNTPYTSIIHITFNKLAICNRWRLNIEILNTRSTSIHILVKKIYNR